MRDTCTSRREVYCQSSPSALLTSAFKMSWVTKHNKSATRNTSSCLEPLRLRHRIVCQKGPPIRGLQGNSQYSAQCSLIHLVPSNFASSRTDRVSVPAHANTSSVNPTRGCRNPTRHLLLASQPWRQPPCSN